MVKCPTVRDSLAMPIMATSGTSPKQGKCVQSNDMRKHRDKKNSHKSSKTYDLTTQSSQFAKQDLDVKRYKVKVVLQKIT